MIHPYISMIDLKLPKDRPVLLLTSAMADDLIPYAEGKTLDPDTEHVLDRWLFDYADRDLEALMRHNKGIAMLVAEKAEEKRLHKRICDFVHDWLYGDEGAEIKNVVESNARLADLVDKLRQLKPHAEAAFKSLEDEPFSLEALRLVGAANLRTR